MDSEKEEGALSSSFLALPQDEDGDDPRVAAIARVLALDPRAAALGLAIVFDIVLALIRD